MFRPFAMIVSPITQCYFCIAFDKVPKIMAGGMINALIPALQLLRQNQGPTGGMFHTKIRCANKTATTRHLFLAAVWQILGIFCMIQWKIVVCKDCIG